MPITKMSAKPIAFLALLLGSAAIAFAPVFVRIADVSPAASAFWRMALAAPLLWMWVYAGARNERSNTVPGAPQWKLLALAGFFFAGDLAAWHWSILFTSVANATLELNFAAIFVTLGGWLLFRERVSKLFLCALLVTFLGATLLIGPNVGGTRQALLGDALGLLAGLCYAGYMLAIKSASRSVETPRIMAVSTTAAAIALLPFALSTSVHFLPQSAAGWLVLVGLALVAHVLGQSLIAYGFSHLPAALSSASLLLQPVFAAAYAWVLLGERIAPLQMVGGVIVLLGIYLARRGSASA